ncbi:MAG TPA: flagellar biosynthetic protein FliO [Rhodocyclaceae bacterium]|nr:flagellar biosynthetic protein FliO [Rhodocyclaceae bacterium]
MALRPASFVLLPAILPAALARAEAAAAPAPEFGVGLAQLLLSLGLVVALIFGSLWLLKRLSAPRGTASGLLRVVAGTAVGTRERVVVLEVGSTWLILGVAPGRVTALAEVPRQAVPPDQPPGADFAGWLRQMIERRNAR